MLAAPAERVPRYKPRAASNALKKIVEAAFDDLFALWEERFRDQFGPLHKRVKSLLESFLRCGDLHFGFLRIRCMNPGCKNKGELLVPYSCKARGLCPSCGQRRAIAWAERMVEEVLPRVPYRQLVFTIPRRLRKYFLFDRSLYGELCRAAYASTRDYLRQLAPGGFPKLKRAVPAMVVVPQSFADLLVPHVHAHSISSLGLFSKDGTFHRMEDVEFSGLEALFRERVFKFMVRKGKITEEVVEDMRRWPHSGFQVNWDRRIEAEDRQGLEGLLSYMDRPPVSLQRLTYRPEEDGKVHYQGTKFHPRLGTDHQLLTPVEFLALLVPHMLLRYQATLHSYGAISTTFRKKAGWIENPPVEKPPRETLPAVALTFDRLDPKASGSSGSPSLTLGSQGEEDSPFVKGRKRNWARLIKKTWLSDPELCPSCHQPMKILAAISSPGEDEVIEKILKARGQWAPPWKQPRPARGPPAHEHSTCPLREEEPLEGTEMIDPPRDVDEYCVDPPSPEDF